MKSQTSIIIVITLSIVTALFVWGYENRGAAATSPDTVSRTENTSGSLIAPETFYDFGKISMRDGLVEKRFVISNPTAENILLSTIVTSCMCTTAFIVEPDGSEKGPFGMPGHGGSVPPANEIIPAGESREIRVVFDPNAHGPAGVGAIDRTITLTERGGAVSTLNFKAVVTP
ncbi:MAG: hypothetical protein AMXMBFR44_0430 [Candidatus Campbellbacteria bacterium]